MAFVRKKVKTFKWPVKVEEPSSTNSGQFEQSEFIATFKRIKASDLKGVESQEGTDILKQVLVGWEGINDEDGKAIEFSEEELENLSDDIDWLKSVLAAYTTTYAEVQSGN
jgi:hypothetical protein